MIAFRLLLVLFSASLLAGCITDPSRAPTVSSRVETSTLPSLSRKAVVAVAPFEFPEEGSKVRDTHMLNSVPMVTFTYAFDEIDRENLRQSLLSSLKNTGNVEVIDLQASPQTPTTGAIVVRVHFSKLGMELSQRHLLGKNTICRMDGDISLDNGSRTTHKTISIVGESYATVANSKEKAIEQFMQQIAAAIAEMD